MEKYKTVTALLVIFGWVVGFATGRATVSCEDICTNNDTRDYAYEAYCDSIWENDKNYYWDVLEETEEYQTYVEQHGSWWDNKNK